MEQQLLDIINLVRANKSLPAVTELTASSRLRQDCGFDSFDMAELTVRVEAAFQVDVFADGLVHTVGEVLRKIQVRSPA